MKIVLDANVVVAAFASRGLCESILELCLHSHEIVLSQELLDEILRNLRTLSARFEKHLDGGFTCDRMICMKSDLSEILKEAMQLPPEARAALASSLLESLDDTLDADAESAWEAEIAKRVKELDLGISTPIPWSEARRMIAGD